MCSQSGCVGKAVAADVGGRRTVLHNRGTILRLSLVGGAAIGLPTPIAADSLVPPCNRCQIQTAILCNPRLSFDHFYAVNTSVRGVPYLVPLRLVGENSEAKAGMQG